MALPALADKASDLHKQGEQAEVRNQYVEAYDLYRQAWELKPENVKYRVSMQRMRFLAAASLVHRGQIVRGLGRYQEALEMFRQAAAIDPSSAIAQQELGRTEAAIAAGAEASAAAPPTQPAKEPTVLEKRLEHAQGPIDLAPIPDLPITLRLTEDTKVIYETIGKLAGLNVLFDPDYSSRRIKVELNGVTLEQALDLVALESKTFWRPVTPNTIFVAADTTAKRRELEQSVVKTFYVSNMSQAQELQDIVNAIRTILEVTRVQHLPSQGAIIVRGTPDQVALAGKIIDDIDKAKPEVIVEVAVMQVRRDRLRQLGIQPPTTSSIQLEGTSTEGDSTTTTPGTINLNNLAHLKASDFIVTIPGATANLLLNDSQTTIIQNPQIRAVDGEKASLKIGDRVPVATGSFQPGIGGVGINPLVNTQFQYIDVGVNIDITPYVHGDGQVTMKIMIDISSVTARVNIGGIDQPVIGQRKVEHEIRLADGEANLLGGILEQQDVEALSGWPGLARIPILKYLFSSERKEKQENEIVFVLVPHVVRNLNLDPLNVRAISVGYGQTGGVNLRRAISRPAAETTTPKTGPGAATPAQPQPAPAEPERPSPAQRAPTGQASLSFQPQQMTQAVGSTFAVNVAVDSGEPIYALPLQVRYDPAVLELLNISNGDFLTQDGQAVALVHRNDPSSGTIQVSATRPPGVAGVSGQGVVFTFTFLAKSAGRSDLEILRAGARNSANQPVPVTPAQATITVQPQ